MKIVTVVGARPQFVKASVLSRRINEKHKGEIEEIIVHTGQHYDDYMSEVFFSNLKISAPKYNLNVGSKTHGKQTGEIMAKLDDILLSEKPDFTVVYGDTNSTLAGALSSSKLDIDIIHIEAGYRNYIMASPEEQNRLLTDHVSKILCCCSQNCVDNLAKEGIYDGKVTVASHPIRVSDTGDIMYEAFLYNKDAAFKRPRVADKVGIDKYIAATVHRQENTDDIKKLLKIFEGFAGIPEKIIFPIHPRTKKLLELHDINPSGNITLIEPVDYLDMINLIGGASAVITDSGGVLKEACFLRIPCVTLRDQIEAIETLEFNYNILLEEDEFINMGAYVNRKLENRSYMPFGDGNTSEKVIDLMMNYK